MASALLSSKPSASTARLKTLTLLRSLTTTTAADHELPTPLSSTADDLSTSDDLPPASEGLSPAPSLPSESHLRRRGLTPSRPAELICYMMAKRPWTTRLQQSIRKVTRSFDRPLVLSILRGAREPQHALDFFRFVERKAAFPHDAETYAEIIRVLSGARMLNHARTILLEDIPARSVPRDESMFIPLIDAYGLAGIPQEAVKLFRAMPELGVPRSVRAYEAFFKAILRRGRGMMAKRAFNAMLRDGVPPTVYTYNLLIWGFGLSEMMSTAARFFAEMREHGVEPDVVTYNTLIGGWSRAGRMEDARRLFEEMREKGLSPNDVSYTVMIKGLVQAGDVEEAVRLLGRMVEEGMPPKRTTYCVLLPGLCERAEWAGEAKRLLEEMVERRMRFDDRSVFRKLIVCLCDAGRMDEAAEVLRLIYRFWQPADSAYYEPLIRSYCENGAYDKAVEVVDEVLRRGLLLGQSISELDPVAYKSVIAHMCGNSLTNKAETLFRQLMKKGVDDAVSFNHLIRGHASEGTPGLALELLTIMKHRNVASDADAFVSVVESFLRKGEPADAKAALDSMMEHGHLPGASLFRAVMESLFDNDRVQTASRVMKSMIEKGVKDNMDMVHKILEALFMRGHVEEATGRINLMMESCCLPDIDRLLVTLCEKENSAAAFKLADLALQRDWNISFENYDRVLNVLYGNGKTLNAYSLLCKIKQKGGHTNKEAAAALVKSLIDEGNTRQADILSRLIFPKERKGRTAD